MHVYDNDNDNDKFYCAIQRPLGAVYRLTNIQCENVQVYIKQNKQGGTEF